MFWKKTRTFLTMRQTFSVYNCKNKFEPLKGDWGRGVIYTDHTYLNHIHDIRTSLEDLYMMMSAIFTFL
jgi:hypothetical protein